MLALLKRNFFEDARQQLPGMERSAWAAVNAVTQYIDHQRNVRGESDADREESRLHGAWFGPAADTKAWAYHAAQELLLNS